MQYIVSSSHPSTHLVDIEFIINDHHSDTLDVHLPAWRPGRYELGNFAKNIQQWKAFDSKGNLLKSTKLSKDSWRIETPSITEIHIRYNYYAYQLDAGACWVDDNQLYINGVHCFLYVPERMGEPCDLQIKVPENWKIATGLKKMASHHLQADDYHVLVDSPFIASGNLQHRNFLALGTTFNIWIQGECRPDWEQIIKDFKAYTEEQITMMGEFPAKEYHYLIQVLPYRFYHGVEHLNSTVIAIGPGYNLMKGDTYEDFLGVNSHELFHSWNIKSIRPVEMFPYRYKEENYFRTGFVAEGITTYYGDLFLVRAGVYSMTQYFNELNQRFQRHFDNFGRHTMPVAEASFDTWLDGYTPGIPNRKTSIYDEGSICALMLDFTIRKFSNSKSSLDDLMRQLYTEFAKKGKGYSEADFRQLVKQAAGIEGLDILDRYVYGSEDYEPRLQELLHLAGCYLSKTPSVLNSERMGFKTIQEGSLTKITAVAPGSTAMHSGLQKDMEILSVNGFRVEHNLNDWLNYFEKHTLKITVQFQKRIEVIEFLPNEKEFYPKYKIEKQDNMNEAQQAFLESWVKQKK